MACGKAYVLAGGEMSTVHAVCTMHLHVGWGAHSTAAACSGACNHELSTSWLCEERVLTRSWNGFNATNCRGCVASKPERCCGLALKMGIAISKHMPDAERVSANKEDSSKAFCCNQCMSSCVDQSSSPSRTFPEPPMSVYTCRTLC